MPRPVLNLTHELPVYSVKRRQWIHDLHEPVDPVIETLDLFTAMLVVLLSSLVVAILLLVAG